jgi:hypothetical protein
VFQLGKPMNRWQFAATTIPLNGVIAFAALVALAFRPVGAGHIAVLVVVGALQYVWFVLHARRFADAGKRLWLPSLAFAACFLTFAVSYLILAALWSSPDIQREVFRTGGGIGSYDPSSHIETLGSVIAIGQSMLSLFGAAGSAVLSGFIILMLGLVALGAGVFSVVAFILPSGLSGAIATPRIAKF